MHYNREKSPCVHPVTLWGGGGAWTRMVGSIVGSQGAGAVYCTLPSWVHHMAAMITTIFLLYECFSPLPASLDSPQVTFQPFAAGSRDPAISNDSQAYWPGSGLLS